MLLKDIDAGYMPASKEGISTYNFYSKDFLYFRKVADKIEEVEASIRAARITGDKNLYLRKSLELRNLQMKMMKFKEKLKRSEKR